MLRTFAPLGVILLSLALSACGATLMSPSLAPRAVERQPVGLPEAASEPDTPADPALTARIAALLQQAEAEDAAFQAQRRRAEPLVAAGARAAKGSEPWIAAQEALSALDGVRGPLRDRLAEVEALRQEPANAAMGNRTAIEAAAARIEALDAAQTAVMAALGAGLD